MEESWTNRTELLIGKEALEKLAKAKVAVYGIGGVGSFVVEGLARAGIGYIVLIDNDIIAKSNLNRQIHATHQTIGKRKIDVMKQRILDINPESTVDTYMAQEIEEGEENVINETFSYVIDAVDTVSTKIKLIEKANQLQIPILSCMGTIYHEISLCCLLWHPYMLSCNRQIVGNQPGGKGKELCGS